MSFVIILKSSKYEDSQLHEQSILGCARAQLQLASATMKSEFRRRHSSWSSGTYSTCTAQNSPSILNHPLALAISCLSVFQRQPAFLHRDPRYLRPFLKVILHFAAVIIDTRHQQRASNPEIFQSSHALTRLWASSKSVTLSKIGKQRAYPSSSAAAGRHFCKCVQESSPIAVPPAAHAFDQTIPLSID